MKTLSDQPPKKKKRERGGETVLQWRNKYKVDMKKMDMDTLTKLSYFKGMVKEGNGAGSDLKESERTFNAKFGNKFLRCLENCCGGDESLFSEAYPSLVHTTWTCKWGCEHKKK